MIVVDRLSGAQTAARMAFRNGRKVGLMLMGAYFDDSFQGKHDQQVMALVGFVSTQERWEGFEREWKTLLLDPFSLARFRMSDCEARPPRGAFKHLTVAQCEQVKNIAMPIIGQWINDGMGCALVINDFKAAIKGASKKRHPYIRNQYAFCFFSTMEHLIRRSNKGLASDDKIAAYFDRGSIGKVARNWNLFKNTLDPKNRVIGVQFDDDTLVTPLQAADTMAYLATKLFFYRVYPAGDPDGTIREECVRLIEMTSGGSPAKLLIEWYDHANLALFIQEIKQSGQF
jgi:hypothetical protein